MTKEAIIDTEVGNDPYLYRPDVLKIMDLYAKQQSIAFANYVMNDYKLSLHPESPTLNDEEIYELFITQTENK